jgi:two-component system response regulator NreC
VAGDAGNGPEAIALVQRTRPDVVLLDLQLPELDGLAVLRAIRGKDLRCRVLVLSSHCNDYTLYLVERAGVDGFVDKNSDTVAALRQALVAIAEGKPYFSPAFARLKARRRRDPSSFDKILTDREQMVLKMIGSIMADREIAETLAISPQTVAKHRFNILKKLGLGSTTALTRYAREHGFSQDLARSSSP